jgi:hypothetical protein
LNGDGEYQEGEDIYDAPDHKTVDSWNTAVDKAVIKTHYAHPTDAWFVHDDFDPGRGYFDPHEFVDVWIFSNARYLGTVEADDEGNINPYMIPLAGTPLGDHHIVLQGMGTDGLTYSSEHQVAGRLHVLTSEPIVPPVTPPGGGLLPNPGICSLPAFTDRASCEAAGGTWFEGWCSIGDYSTPDECVAAGGTWIGGYCSLPQFRNQFNCESNDGIWYAGITDTGVPAWTLIFFFTLIAAAAFALRKSSRFK